MRAASADALRLRFRLRLRPYYRVPFRLLLRIRAGRDRRYPLEAVDRPPRRSPTSIPISITAVLFRLSITAVRELITNQRGSAS